MVESVLERLGEEVTGIVSPVSLCMAVTVALVRLLNPTGDNAGTSVYIASAYYKEKGDDTTAEKITGSIVNAIIFVAVIALMTFVLVLLFKYGYTKAIYAYMAFAGFSIFFVLAGIIFLQLVVKFQIPIDAFSFTFMLYNFSVVGVTALFFWPAPILMKQGYLVVTGVVTAYMFTFIPEWSTWVMLLAMALYDLWAVLTPHGPLKVLVELAQERDEDIPALVYEARSTGQPRRLAGTQQHHPMPHSHISSSVQQPAFPTAAALQEVTLASGSSSSPHAASNLESVPSRHGMQTEAAGSLVTDSRPGPDNESATTGGIVAQGVSGQPAESTQLAAEAMTGVQTSADTTAESNIRQEISAEQPLLNQHNTSTSETGSDNRLSSSSAADPSDIEGNAQGLRITGAAGRHQQSDLQLEPEDSERYLPDAIKLGLGDFIFYSVLVGRAAMYDMLTALVSYLAVIAGLGTTLLLLALYKKALPALPISIGLGVMFYLLARLLLEPFALNLSTNLIFV